MPALWSSTDVLGQVPIERWDAQEARQATGAVYAGFMLNVWLFDNSFFGISSAEAAVIAWR